MRIQRIRICGIRMVIRIIRIAMELEREILKTLAFYDVFEFPLTGFEIHKNLGVKAVFGEVLEVLDNFKNNFLMV